MTLGFIIGILFLLLNAIIGIVCELAMKHDAKEMGIPYDEYIK